ncbi:conjugal transfer pilus assembly protein TraU [Pseudomonadota bacterium]
MFKKFLSFLIVFNFIFFISNPANAICTGRMINPITDVCWSCMFPFTIGNIPVVPSPGNLPDTRNPSNPICVCTKVIPIPGISIGFWEPVRLVDVSKRPFCFVSMGGVDMAPINILGLGQNDATTEYEDKLGTWHVHYYMYPLLYILELFANAICLEISGVDLAYISELDPLWQDDELTFFINPEAILFGNLIAQSACAADCVKATTGLPFDSLFWCGGCQGSMYPMNGKDQAHHTSIQSSLLMVERGLYRMHRQLMAWVTSGEAALCQPYPSPIIKKSQYRSQLTIPVPMVGPKGCKQLGKSTVLYETMKEIPVKGEDFGYLIWRKRNCCAL